MVSRDLATLVSISTRVVDGPALIEVPHGQFAILVRADARLETDTGRPATEATAPKPADTVRATPKL